MTLLAEGSSMRGGRAEQCRCGGCRGGRGGGSRRAAEHGRQGERRRCGATQQRGWGERQQLHVVTIDADGPVVEVYGRACARGRHERPNQRRLARLQPRVKQSACSVRLPTPMLR